MPLIAEASEIVLNVPQTVFTLFFAISWGIVSNVLPRWKPFNLGLSFMPTFPQPMLRALFSFIVLNILPWLMFAIILNRLSTATSQVTTWESYNAFSLIWQAILPGLVPFGFYRFWQAFVRQFASCFYALRQRDVPHKFRSCDNRSYTIEPDIESLNINRHGIVIDYFWATIYIVGFAAWPLLH